MTRWKFPFKLPYMMSIKSIVADNVRRHRKDKGLTQQQLGDTANLSLNTISRLENLTENSNITLEALESIAKALECQTQELINPAGFSPEFICNQLKEAIAQMDALNVGKTREILQGLVDKLLV